MPASERLVAVRAVPSEALAAILVSRLQGAGIEAWTEGGLSSGYRAEAPGSAIVLVRESDRARAEAALATSAPGAGAPESEQGRRRRALWVVAAWIAILALVALWLMRSRG